MRNQFTSRPHLRSQLARTPGVCYRYTFLGVVRWPISSERTGALGKRARVMCAIDALLGPTRELNSSGRANCALSMHFPTSRVSSSGPFTLGRIAIPSRRARGFGPFRDVHFRCTSRPHFPHFLGFGTRLASTFRALFGTPRSPSGSVAPCTTASEQI